MVEERREKIARRLAIFKELDWDWASTRQSCLIEADQILALFPDEEEIECYVQCSRCGKRVSNIVKSQIPAGMVVKAFIECPECVDKQPDEEKIRKQVAHDLFEEIICPLCYRVNPQHASMDNDKGCHYCQEREDWQALKEDKKGGIK